MHTPNIEHIGRQRSASGTMTRLNPMSNSCTKIMKDTKWPNHTRRKSFCKLLNLNTRTGKKKLYFTVAPTTSALPLSPPVTCRAPEDSIVSVNKFRVQSIRCWVKQDNNYCDRTNCGLRHAASKIIMRHWPSSTWYYADHAKHQIISYLDR